jgi:hypothetical protein
MLNKRLATGLLRSGLIFSLIGAAPALAQSALAQQTTGQQSSKTSTAKSASTKPAAPKSAAAAKKSPPKPLVYIEDNRSSKTADASASKSADASASKKPQNSDVVKAFQQNCPSVALTDSKAKAGYQVTVEREPGGKGVKSAFGLTNAVHKTSKIEVTSKSGKELFSETGHSTSQLVKDACTALGTPGTKLAKN